MKDMRPDLRLVHVHLISVLIVKRVTVMNEKYRLLLVIKL